MSPESAWEYELGIIQDWQPVTYRAAAFYYDIEDFINDNGITSPGSGLGSDCLYNIPHVRLYGLELEATLRLGKRFQATAAYVYQEVDADETRYDREWTYYLPELLPNHKINLLGRYEIWRDAFVQLSGRYVGERQAQKGETLDSYVVLDAGLEQRLYWKNAEFTAAAFVSNLLGTEYQEQAGYHMPRQVYGLRVSARF